MSNSNAKTILFIVLPYMVQSSDSASRKSVRSFLAFPYGTLTVASYVAKNAQLNHDISVLDLNLYTDDEIPAILEKHLNDKQPDIVGISFTFDVSYKSIPALTQQIKDFSSDTLIVLGGPAATVSYGEILNDQPLIDAVCYSEGEAGMLRLAESPSPRDELNNDPWVTRTSLADMRLPKSVYADSLDDVIDINYELVDIKSYSMKEAFSPFASYREESGVRQFFIVTSRGCPFKCVFCAEPAFHGSSMRYASLDSIINHVDFLVKTYGMNVLTIYDDQLLLNVNRAKELFRRLIPYNLRVEMPNGVTLTYIDDELALLMSQAGVDTIFLAIESGSDYVLREIIKKPLKTSKIKPVVERLQRNNIFVQAFFVIGLPGEREEDRQITLNLIKDLGIDWSFFNYATPLRGSELFDLCKKNGWLDEKYMGIGDVDLMSYIMRPPGIDPEHITRQVYLMNLEVNFVHNHRMKIGDYKTAARCMQEVVDRHPNHPFAHYFLSEALGNLNADGDKIAHSKSSFNEIIQTDNTWKTHIEHFNLRHPL